MNKCIGKYLSCLEAGDYDELMKLFSASAVVYSPLYGKQSAAEFYKKLFSDTNDSKISLLDIFINENSNKAAAHFRFDWILKDGVSAPFEVVDIFEFDDKMKIASLRIIYDTQQTREKFNTATRNNN